MWGIVDADLCVNKNLWWNTKWSANTWFVNASGRYSYVSQVIYDNNAKIIRIRKYWSLNNQVNNPCCYIFSVAPWLLPPNELTCAMRHFLHPLAMVHCISILLVKAMQLRSIAFVGLGGKISQVNQLVCLLFMLLVQVYISSNTSNYYV